MNQYNDSINVFVVDWSPLSKNPNYLLPAASVRDIGHSIGEMVINFKITPANITCIGHSLGAHVCGGFGDKIASVNETIRKIWGKKV